MDIETCPHSGCQLPTAVRDRFTLQSTDGPFEHVAVRCLDGHQFVMPAYLLPSAA